MYSCGASEAPLGRRITGCGRAGPCQQPCCSGARHAQARPSCHAREGCGGLKRVMAQTGCAGLTVDVIADSVVGRGGRGCGRRARGRQ
eukprot:1381832-Prymnesium_polylepis.1